MTCSWTNRSKEVFSEPSLVSIHVGITVWCHVLLLKNIFLYFIVDFFLSIFLENAVNEMGICDLKLWIRCWPKPLGSSLFLSEPSPALSLATWRCCVSLWWKRSSHSKGLRSAKRLCSKCLKWVSVDVCWFSHIYLHLRSSLFNFPISTSTTNSSAAFWMRKSPLPLQQSTGKLLIFMSFLNIKPIITLQSIRTSLPKKSNYFFNTRKFMRKK